jgi:PAS domain S-box-containing protein
MTEKQPGQDEAGKQEDSARALRKRAEEAMAAGRAHQEPPPGEEGRILHELRVHQIELEMQNDELRQTQEKLEAAKTKYFNLYNRAPVGYFTINGDGVILEANLTAANLLGMGKDLLADYPFTKLVAAEDRDAGYLFHKKLLKTGKPQSCELRIARPGGAPFWARIEATPADDAENGAAAFYFVMSDITESKRAEEDLMAAKKEAERANKAKSLFLSSMDHEIRTPLTSVMGFSQILSSDANHPLDDFQKLLLGKVVASGGQLLELITNVLDLVKIESGEIETSIEAVDVQYIAEKALVNSADLADEFGVKLRSIIPSAECYVMADGACLSQALIQLLSNSIQFNKKGGEAVLSWKPIDENRVRISISDEGAGIHEDNIKDLYKPFNRLGIEGSNIRGFGVGLALVKRLVEMMGGEVGAQSQAGLGSTFYIDLPSAMKPESD